MVLRERSTMRPPMLVVEKIAEVRSEVRKCKSAGKSIGFVPTMGALHAGHLSLIQASKRSCAITVVSIFVNPLQFGPKEDLSRYPRPRESDINLCREAGVDLVFYPSVEEMYSPLARTTVDVSEFSEILEGAVRPGHFRGVATVVNKLFNIVGCDRAFFGQKDFQQQFILRRMVEDLNLPLEIVTCPIIRDSDGLALSSRNVYLTDEDRHAALHLSRALRKTESAFSAGERSPALLRSILREQLVNAAKVELEYAVIVDAQTLREIESATDSMAALIAARIGSTRLIDNTVLR